MSVTTPLMSGFPVDVKEPVESVLPVYRIDDEAEELVVGAPARRGCFWKRFHGRCQRRGACGAAEEGQQKRRSCAKRFLKWVLAIFLVFSVTGFFMQKHKMGCMMKHHPVVCVPLEGSGSNTVSLPLANLRTHIGIHNSLNGDDVHINHSDDVEEDTVSIKFEVPEDVKLMDDEEVPEYYVCHIAGPRFVGLGIHPKDKHAQRVKSTSTTITLSSKEAGHARAVNLAGPRPKFGHGRHFFTQKFGHKFGMRHRIHRAVRKAVREAAALAAWTKLEHADVE